MMRFIDINNKPQIIRSDMIFLYNKQNVNGKYILEQNQNTDIIVSIFLKSFISHYECKEIVYKYGIYRAMNIVKIRDNYIIQKKQLETEKHVFKYIMRHLLEHLIITNDIVANLKNGGYLPHDAINDDGASNADTDLERNDYTSDDSDDDDIIDNYSTSDESDENDENDENDALYEPEDENDDTDNTDTSGYETD
jgi:hypothetical protein